MMPEKYFVIEAKASEWVYVIQKLIKNTPNVGMGDVVLSLELPYPTYYLKRSRFDPEIIARAIGASKIKVLKSKIIRLDPFPESGKLPSPNVSYQGEA